MPDFYGKDINDMNRRYLKLSRTTIHFMPGMISSKHVRLDIESVKSFASLPGMNVFGLIAITYAAAVLELEKRHELKKARVGSGFFSGSFTGWMLGVNMPTREFEKVRAQWK